MGKRQIIETWKILKMSVSFLFGEDSQEEGITRKKGLNELVMFELKLIVEIFMALSCMNR